MMKMMQQCVVNTEGGRGDSLPYGYMSKADVAEWMCVSLSTVNRLIAHGEIDAYKAGRRRVVISCESVRRFLATPYNRCNHSGRVRP